MQDEILIVEHAAVVDDDVTGLCVAEVIADNISAVARENEIELDVVGVGMHGTDALGPVIKANELRFLLKRRSFRCLDVDGKAYGNHLLSIYIRLYTS